MRKTLETCIIIGHRIRKTTKAPMPSTLQHILASTCKRFIPALKQHYDEKIKKHHICLTCNNRARFEIFHKKVGV